MAPAPGNSGSGAAVALISALIDPIVGAAGFDLEGLDIALARGNRRSEVRVLVDKDGGIDLDDVAVVSRLISGVLDADSSVDRILGEGSYVLEVSSPGVDRPLLEPRHWRRNIGRLVTVRASGAEVTGRVLDASAEVAGGVQLEIAGIKGRPSKTISVGYADLGPGRVELEFNRTSVLDEVELDEGGLVDEVDDADDWDDTEQEEPR